MANVPQPVSDPQAKAIEASANAVREAVQALRGLGGYLERVFGTVPEDLVGYFGGDRLKVARAENIVRIVNRSKEINDARKVEPEPISISLALPLLVAAADESRDELVDLWARLLAAAADPDRTKKFRARFIDTVKQLDPLDTAMVQKIAELPKVSEHNSRVAQLRQVRDSSGFTGDEFMVCQGHLEELGLVEPFARVQYLALSPYGREFLRAVND